MFNTVYILRNYQLTEKYNIYAIFHYLCFIIVCQIGHYAVSTHTLIIIIKKIGFHISLTWKITVQDDLQLIKIKTINNSKSF